MAQMELLEKMERTERQAMYISPMQRARMEKQIFQRQIQRIKHILDNM